MFCKTLLTGGALIGATLPPLPALAQVTFSGNAALTSDYVWRGSSQTREDPAAQAGVTITHDAGLGPS